MRQLLESIIRREIAAPGSVIHSDEWPANTHLSTAAFVHSTVNHQECGSRYGSAYLRYRKTVARREDQNYEIYMRFRGLVESLASYYSAGPD